MIVRGEAEDGQTPNRATRRFVTIREVAKDADVAIATVSRALNNSGYVAADVRERVLESAQRLGYRPSERARSMRSLRSMTLGVVMPELVNPVYLEFLRGVEDVAHRSGYATVIGNSQHDPERETAILERLVAERVDGIVIATLLGDPGQLATVADRGIAIAPPIGAAGRRLDRAWDQVEAVATEGMTLRLLDLGHRRVTLVSFHPRSKTTPIRYRRSRTEVIKKVMADAGAELHHVLIPRQHDLAAAPQVIQDALGEPEPATAFVAATHLIAPYVLYGLRSAGVEIPTDVSFVTYGDSDWAAAYRPALSVISHDVHGEASQLTEMLLEQLRNGATRRSVSYRAQFIERESCGPAPRPPRLKGSVPSRQKASGRPRGAAAGTRRGSRDGPTGTDVPPT